MLVHYLRYASKALFLRKTVWALPWLHPSQWKHLPKVLFWLLFNSFLLLVLKVTCFTVMTKSEANLKWVMSLSSDLIQRMAKTSFWYILIFILFLDVCKKHDHNQIMKMKSWLTEQDFSLEGLLYYPRWVRNSPVSTSLWMQILHHCSK